MNFARRIPSLTVTLLAVAMFTASTLSATAAFAAGQNGTTLSASVATSGACTNANNFTISGTVTVTNGGGVATQGLSIDATVGPPPGSTVLATVTVDVSAHPELAPGETQDYPFQISVPSTSGPGTYKVTANVTITNHSSHLSSAFGPSPSTSTNCNTITAAPIAHFTVVRHGAVLVFHWRVTTWSGLAGFRLYAGSHLVSKRLIPAHRSPSYRYAVRWPSNGPFMLRVIFATGGNMPGQG